MTVLEYAKKMDAHEFAYWFMGMLMQWTLYLEMSDLKMSDVTADDVARERDLIEEWLNRETVSP